jgi:hypothetical protein
LLSGGLICEVIWVSSSRGAGLKKIGISQKQAKKRDANRIVDTISHAERSKAKTQIKPNRKAQWPVPSKLPVNPPEEKLLASSSPPRQLANPLLQLEA